MKRKKREKKQVGSRGREGRREEGRTVSRENKRGNEKEKKTEEADRE